MVIWNQRHRSNASHAEIYVLLLFYFLNGYKRTTENTSSNGYAETVVSEIHKTQEVFVKSV